MRGDGGAVWAPCVFFVRRTCPIAGRTDLHAGAFDARGDVTLSLIYNKNKNKSVIMVGS